MYINVFNPFTPTKLNSPLWSADNEEWGVNNPNDPMFTFDVEQISHQWTHLLSRDIGIFDTNTLTPTTNGKKWIKCGIDKTDVEMFTQVVNEVSKNIWNQ